MNMSTGKSNSIHFSFISHDYLISPVTYRILRSPHLTLVNMAENVCFLLKLPPEIRIHIYSFLAPPVQAQAPLPQYAGLLNSCKQIKQEIEHDAIKQVAQELSDIQKLLKESHNITIHILVPRTFQERKNLTLSLDYWPDDAALFKSLKSLYFDSLTIRIAHGSVPNQEASAHLVAIYCHFALQNIRYIWPVTEDSKPFRFDPREGSLCKGKKRWRLDVERIEDGKALAATLECQMATFPWLFGYPSKLTNLMNERPTRILAPLEYFRLLSNNIVCIKLTFPKFIFTEKLASLFRSLSSRIPKSWLILSKQCKYFNGIISDLLVIVGLYVRIISIPKGLCELWFGTSYRGISPSTLVTIHNLLSLVFDLDHPHYFAPLLLLFEKLFLVRYEQEIFITSFWERGKEKNLKGIVRKYSATLRNGRFERHVRVDTSYSEMVKFRLFRRDRSPNLETEPYFILKDGATLFARRLRFLDCGRDSIINGRKALCTKTEVKFTTVILVHLNSKVNAAQYLDQRWESSSLPPTRSCQISIEKLQNTAGFASLQNPNLKSTPTLFGSLGGHYLKNHEAQPLPKLHRNLGHDQSSAKVRAYLLSFSSKELCDKYRIGWISRHALYSACSSNGSSPKPGLNPANSRKYVHSTSIPCAQPVPQHHSCLNLLPALQGKSTSLPVTQGHPVALSRDQSRSVLRTTRDFVPVSIFRSSPTSSRSPYTPILNPRHLNASLFSFRMGHLKRPRSSTSFATSRIKHESTSSISLGGSKQNSIFRRVPSTGTAATNSTSDSSLVVLITRVYDRDETALREFESFIRIKFFSLMRNWNMKAAKKGY
ncbi:uncharacterized protein BDR25DRAFT_355871 [Lindgomyces ingoldianus]|uniref:Uncharacterized protein n=1 Tax=Lindgomyces ingoldianus TaxID=673940 RepID=A0ACB6QTA2_9PLEO|nr:uncharacterized protein BDR25DRAFT_355871 [Lindgomyces ingoldianus]KAF2470161.1 hypothetical protein BDR25DRAFT_355871 [Lindgomyces ingoldianus]